MGLFEEKLEEINQAIANKRSFWALSALSYLDYDDIAQQIRIHFSQKIYLYNESKGPFSNWASKIVTNQIKNLIKYHYTKVAPPCNRCPFNNGGNFCAFTKSGVKDSQCKSFKKWNLSKKNAYELKFAMPIEEFDGSLIYQDFDLEKGLRLLSDKLKLVLPPKQYEAYELLYLNNLSEDEVIERLGFKTKKINGRSSGSRQLSNFKNSIYKAAQKIVKEIDL